MTELPIELTADEIRILTDAIKNADKEDGHECAKPLILKLGSAFLEMLHPDKAKDGAVTIFVTERQAWLLRNKLDSGLRTDKQPRLGIECLRKVYTILLRFDADVSLPDAEGDRTLIEVKQSHGWIPGEFGLGRAKATEDVTDDFDWKVGGLT